MTGGLMLSPTVTEAVADAQQETRQEAAPTRVLALPDLEHAKTAVLNSLTSTSGQRTYEHAITEFVASYCSEPRLAFNRTVVLRYRIQLEQRHYAPATINLRLAAIRRVAYADLDEPGRRNRERLQPARVVVVDGQCRVAIDGVEEIQVHHGAGAAKLQDLARRKSTWFRRSPHSVPGLGGRAPRPG
jgi:hypothetical protein